MGNHYSQFGQDAAVMELAQRPGVYVDVGAADGVYLSNTKALEEAGWTGLLIEADPREAEKCRQNRTAPVEEVAGADQIGTVTFQRVPVEGWSGLLAFPHELNAAEIERMRQAGEVEEFVVKCLPLSVLLGSRISNHVDYLSIDVEGAELSVLQSVAWDRTTINVITVEINRTDGAIGRFLLERGYCLWAILGADEMYVRKEWLTEGRL